MRRVLLSTTLIFAFQNVIMPLGEGECDVDFYDPAYPPGFKRKGLALSGPLDSDLRKGFVCNLKPIEVVEKWGYEGKKGIHDKDTRLSILPGFDYVWSFDNSIEQTGKCYARVRIKDKVGIIDEKGDPVIPIKFAAVKFSPIMWTRHRSAFVATEKDGVNMWALYTQSRKLDKLQFRFSRTSQFPKEVSIAVVHIDKKRAYLYPNGKFLFPQRFDKAYAFCPVRNMGQIAPVCTNKKCGFINSMGKYVIKPRFSKLQNFVLNVAAFQMPDVPGKWGLIDTHGRIIFKPMFRQIKIDCHDKSVEVDDGTKVTDRAIMKKIDFSQCPFVRPKISSGK